MVILERKKYSTKGTQSRDPSSLPEQQNKFTSKTFKPSKKSNALKHYSEFIEDHRNFTYECHHCHGSKKIVTAEKIKSGYLVNDKIPLSFRETRS